MSTRIEEYKQQILWACKYSSTETNLRMNLMSNYGPTKLSDEVYNAALNQLLIEGELTYLTYQLPTEEITRHIYFPKGTKLIARG